VTKEELVQVKGSRDNIINIKSYASPKKIERQDFSDEIDKEIVEIDYQLELIKTAAPHFLVTSQINLVQAALHRIFNFRKGLNVDEFCDVLQEKGGGATS
jgi:hypothetical protein